MTHQKRDAQLCKYIIMHSNRIELALKQISSINDFKQNQILQNSILFDLLQIGENINNLSEDFIAKAPDIEYRKIVNLRNLIVHGYANVNFELIYDYATNDVQRLKNRIISLQ